MIQRSTRTSCLVLIGLISLSLTLTLRLPIAAAIPEPVGGSTLPASASRCLEASGKTFEVVATTTERSKTFYYLHVWLYGTDNDFESWYSLIQVDSAGQCQQLRGVKSGLKPLSSFMSVNAARSLELKRFQREIDRAGSKATFEQRFNRKLSPPRSSAFYGMTIYLSEEQVWALQQLGIQISGNYKLLRAGETITH